MFIIAADPDHSRRKAAACHDLIEDRFNHIDGNGKAHTLALGIFIGIDANDLTACVDKRSAAVPFIDGSVCLNQVFRYQAAVDNQASV